VPAITALSHTRDGRIAVELDGRPWRVLPPGVVLAAGLGVGVELSRPIARHLARALRHEQARSAAGRALTRRRLSAHALRSRLEASGIRGADAADAVERLVAAGVVDDRGLALDRAADLARRGYGNAFIEASLEQLGLAADVRADALSAVEPEAARARALAACAAAEPARRAAFLRRRGFGEDAIESAVGDLDRGM
jgi:SOS response regulatory protein OraA/RecX